MTQTIADTVTISGGTLDSVVVLGIVELVLVIYCIVDIVRRPAVAVTGGRKWPWIVLIILFNLIGSIVYLAVGRAQPPAAETRADPAPEAAARSRTAAAADLLYGPPGPRARRPVAQAQRQRARRSRRPQSSDEPPAPRRPRAARGHGGLVSTGERRHDAVEIAGLTKVFAKARALDGVDLTVPEGSVFGFLGPNGAGKTTTLRILAGLARPSGGSATVFGHDVVSGADAIHAQLGYLPDVPGFYAWMTAREFLVLSGRLFRLPAATLAERVDALLDLAGLTDVDTRIGGYSRGMKQRLGVAQALINAPRLLLLDEPTSALDPMGRREVLEMIAGLAGRTTVFFSTHILADVERVCDTVAILARGRVVAQAPIDELKTRHGGGHHVSWRSTIRRGSRRPCAARHG